MVFLIVDDDVWEYGVGYEVCFSRFDMSGDCVDM